MLNAVTQRMVKAADWTYQTLPKRAGYLAQTVSNKKIPVVSPVVSGTINYLVNNDYKNFYKTPELLNVTVAEMPIGPLMVMFYGFMTPARIHSAIERAPIKKNGEKDYREVRDVLIRDMTAVTIFLFGLDALNKVMWKGTQEHGRMLSATPLAKRIPGIKQAFMDTPAKVKILENGKAVDYLEMSQRFRLNNEGNLIQIAQDPVNREGLPHVIEKDLKSFKAYQERPDFRAAVDHLQEEFVKTSDSLRKLDSHVFQNYLEELPNQNAIIGRNLDALRQTLFDHPKVTLNDKVQQLTPSILKEELQGELTELQTSIDSKLSALEAPKGSQLDHLLTRLINGEEAALGDLADFANNKRGLINKHLTQVKELKSGSPEFRKAFDLHWDTLNEFGTKFPLLHSKKQSLQLLEHQVHGPALVKYLKESFAQAKTAMASLERLETVVKNGAPVEKKLFGLMHLETLEPRDFIGNFAKKMRAPADWMSLVFIIAALGYAPVSFNDVLTDFLFKRKYGEEDGSEVTESKASKSEAALSPAASTQSLAPSTAGVSPVASPADLSSSMIRLNSPGPYQQVPLSAFYLGQGKQVPFPVPQAHAFPPKAPAQVPSSQQPAKSFRPSALPTSNSFVPVTLPQSVNHTPEPLLKPEVNPWVRQSRVIVQS